MKNWDSPQSQKFINTKLGYRAKAKKALIKLNLGEEEERGGSSREGGGETSGGIWARERGNSAHIPGEQRMKDVGRKQGQSRECFVSDRRWFSHQYFWFKNMVTMVGNQAAKRY